MEQFNNCPMLKLTDQSKTQVRSIGVFKLIGLFFQVKLTMQEAYENNFKFKKCINKNT